MQYILIRKRIKNLYLKVLPDCSVVVSAPLKLSLVKIEEFIRKKETWVKNIINKINESNNQINNYKNYEKILYLGTSYPIKYCENFIYFNEFKIKVKTNIGSSLKNFLISRAEIILKNRIMQLSNSLNFSFNEIKIVNSKRKWGSCNSSKNIKLNFKLIMLPSKLIDYVILHELAHTIELNHSKRFWNILKRFGYNKKIIREQFKPFNFTLEMFN